MPDWRFVRGLAEHWHQVRAELSLVVPCEVGGTAEWAFSRPSLHWISLWDSPHSSLAVFFLLAFPLFYLFILHLIIITSMFFSKKKIDKKALEDGVRLGLSNPGHRAVSLYIGFPKVLEGSHWNVSRHFWKVSRNFWKVSRSFRKL